MAKGSSFERKVCYALSDWWTGGADDDVFWRTSNSGGRATVRSKKGKATLGQHGDIGATKPIGEALLDFVTIEAKNGYPNAHAGSLQGWPMPKDGRPNRATQILEEWVAQAERECKAAGAYSWWIIHNRLKRCPVVYMPHRAFVVLRQVGLEQLDFEGHICWEMPVNGRFVTKWMAWVHLQTLFDKVAPEDLIRVGKKL